MDESSADTLMNLLPPAGWDQVATKDDIALTGQHLAAAEQRLSADMKTGFADAAKERAEIVRTQARQMYMVMATIAVTNVSVWIAVLTRLPGA